MVVDNMDIIKSNEHLGYKHRPILTDLPVDMFVMDLLHKFLRMSDLLFDLLIEALAKLDNFTTSGKSRFDERKHPNLKILKDFIVEKCKYNIIQPKMEMAALKSGFKSLMGPRRRRIFENLTTDSTNIQTLFGASLNRSEEISRLWRDYWKLDQYLRAEHTEEKAVVLHRMTSRFMDDFVGLYGREKITPYLHALTHHLPEMYDKHGDLNFFTTQGT